MQYTCVTGLFLCINTWCPWKRPGASRHAPPLPPSLPYIYTHDELLLLPGKVPVISYDGQFFFYLLPVLPPRTPPALPLPPRSCLGKWEAKSSGVVLATVCLCTDEDELGQRWTSGAQVRHEPRKQKGLEGSTKAQVVCFKTQPVWTTWSSIVGIALGGSSESTMIGCASAAATTVGLIVILIALPLAASRRSSEGNNNIPEWTEEAESSGHHAPSAALLNGILACQSDPCFHGLCIDHTNR